MSGLEVFAVSAAVLGLLQYSSRIINIVQVLRDVDEVKFEQLYWSLEANRERTIAWANVIRVAGRPIPPENTVRVKNLLQQMDQYYSRIDQLLMKVYKPSGQKTTVRVLLHRVQFASDGFTKIRDYLEAIKSMNDALERIAPPLPAYPGQTIVPNLESHHFIPPRSSKQESEYEPVVRKKAESSNNDLLLPHREVTLESLYSLCLYILRSLVTTGKHDRQTSYLIDLELWGTGLFTSDLVSLDKVFAVQPERNANLRRIITECLVHISVAMEQLLKEEEQYCKDADLENIQQDRKALMAVLGKDNLIEFAMERWADIVELDEDSITDFKQEPWQDIQDVISDLFDLLPAIRSERHTRLLELEANMAKKSKEENPTQSLKKVPTDKISGGTMDLEIERNLRLAFDLEEALKNDEDFAKQHGLTDIKPHSDSLRKHREDLKNIHLKVVRDPKSHLSPEEEDALLKLNEALQTATQALLMMPQSRPSDPHRKAGHEMRADSEKTIQSLLGVFQSSNSVLLKA